MRRKRKKILIIVASSVGAVLALLTIAIIVFVLTMPDPPSLDAGVVEPQEIPEHWLSAPSSKVPPVAGLSIEPLALPYPLRVFAQRGRPVGGSPNPAEQAAWPASSGMLTMASDGKPFGQERFAVRAEGDDVRLTTTGEFFFKVVLVTVRISFEQELVIGRRALGQHQLARVVRDRAFPDFERAVLQASMDARDPTAWQPMPRWDRTCLSKPNSRTGS